MSGYDIEAQVRGRRGFLAGVGALAGLAAIATTPVGRVAAAPSSAGGDPFRLGIASGDPTPDGVVLWTRLAPDPFAADGGMPRKAVGVDWKLAEDPAMERVVRSGRALAMPELAHSVHVEVEGLRPDREYFYRFRYAGEQSDVGRTRTAPAVGAVLNKLAFGFVSCQDWASGYYSPYHHLAEEDFDLVVHLGDYVYEGRFPPTAATARHRCLRRRGRRHATCGSGAPATRSTRPTGSCSASMPASRSS